MKKAKEMCDEYKIFLLSEGELKGSEKELLLEHITQCAECQKNYELYSRLKNNTRKFYTDLQPRKIRRGGLMHINKSTAVSAVLLILVLAVFFIYKGNDKGSADKLQPDTTLSVDKHYNEYDIFDTYSWNKKMYDMEKNIEDIKKQLQENPL